MRNKKKKERRKDRIFGSVESDQDETIEYFENNHLDITDPQGVNLVKVAEAIYNNGNPGQFEAIGLQLPVGGQFRFSPNAPWSNIPSNGFLNFTAVFGSKAIIQYLEVMNVDKFNIYFAMN